MVTTYLYPTTNELTEIDPILLAGQIAEDPLIGPGGLFPMRNVDSDRLTWEQRDSYNGLMQFRGLNGDPPRVKRLGLNRYSIEPGYYGEFTEIDEMEMTRRAAPASYTMPVDVKDLVNECHAHLMGRQTNLMRYICAQLLVSGKFVVLTHGGSIGSQDSYKQQVYTASVAWATVATATPLANLRAIPILGRGQSTSWGPNAELWMNQVTFNYMLANQNTNDLRGERLDAGRTVQSLGDVNVVMTANGLPRIRVYELGYLDASGAWQLFIPDNVVVYVGARTNNQPLGEFRMTRNVSAPGKIGPYDKVVERGMAANEPPPAKIEVHRGFNGGPIVYYPGSIFVMNV